MTSCRNKTSMSHMIFLNFLINIITMVDNGYQLRYDHITMMTFTLSTGRVRSNAYVIYEELKYQHEIRKSGCNELEVRSVTLYYQVLQL